MKITNKMNLPQALVDACTVTRHNKLGSLSATTLLKGTKEIILTERHHDEIEQDVSDNIWALFGTAVHSLLEKETATSFTEEYLSADCNGIKITGRMDNYDMANCEVVDYKTSSVWKVIKGDFEDWFLQGLIYSWLLKETGLPHGKCRFIALLKDHSKSKAKYDSGYPNSPVYIHRFEVTEKDMLYIEQFINLCVKEYNSAIELKDDEIKPCPPCRRWDTPTVYAVVKEGRKSAVKLFDNKEDAEEMANEKGKGHTVEVRPGESKKCLDYCAVKAFCHYGKSL